ncbi:MAG: MBL fold metallo-hydrolase [Gammaproteobacteria bacterium]|nr:MBL fold metallo-hydrolase [Gammaproteobacteria bacterium]
MRPIFHPQLVNDPFGDPGLYVEFLFEKRALLFDLGDLRALAPRKILRLSHVFVSHTHMDHFVGFDRLLRICLGRDKKLSLYGPPGFIEQVNHKLAAYTWNLVQNYPADFTLDVFEAHPDGRLDSVEFHCRHGFQPERAHSSAIAGGVLVDDPAFRVHVTFLDHKTPCLAFALEEKQHVNVWKNRLQAQGLAVGPWLKDLKTAVLSGAPDDTPLAVQWRAAGASQEKYLPLGLLKNNILRIVPGQKVAYVTDVIYHAKNARRIVELVQDSDLLFIECTFLEEDAAHAAQKYHLTARQAGLLARTAGVKRVTPFHFSPKYSAQPDRLTQELTQAFSPPRVGTPARNVLSLF